MQGYDGGFDDDGNATHTYDDDNMDHEYLDSAGEEELMDSSGEREDDKVYTAGTVLLSAKLTLCLLSFIRKNIKSYYFYFKLSLWEPSKDGISFLCL